MTLVMFAGFVPQLPVAGSLAAAVGYALALAAGSAAVGVSFAAAGAALGRAMPGDRGRRAISLAAAAGIVGFGVYGLVKKQIGPSVDAVSGLTLESLWLTPIAAASPTSSEYDFARPGSMPDWPKSQAASR